MPSVWFTESKGLINRGYPIWTYPGETEPAISRESRKPQVSPFQSIRVFLTIGVCIALSFVAILLSCGHRKVNVNPSPRRPLS